MRSLDRVRGVIAGKPVDHLPAQPIVMMFAARNAGIAYIDYTRDPSKLAEAQLKIIRDFGVDCALMNSDPAREVIDIAGEGSVRWFEDQGPAIFEERAALRDKARLNEFKVPDPHAEGRMHDRVRSIEICRRELGEETSVVGWIEGPLALAQELRGLNRIMVDIVDDPIFVRDLMAFVAEVEIVFAAAQIEAGADTIAMSDSAACMIGSRHYGELVLPWQRQILQSIRDAHPGVILRQHMCGNVNPLVKQMATLPIDVYELDFPTNLAAARADLGPERVILGNVSTITDLLEGTPESVEAATRKCHEICGSYHIVGAGCEVSPLTPPENLRAMMRYAREHKPDDRPAIGNQDDE